MKYLKIVFTFVLLGLNCAVFPQDRIKKPSFVSPLDIPLVLAGTFGELRSNHFHGGIDIKTQGKQGLPVYSIGPGTVTRIKVSHWGYGKAIYVAHPNGFTSVYGHLQKFNPTIEAYVKKAQYEKRSYEIELFPDYGELKLDAGQILAYSGNTGGSSGPHLHFEIRNSVSQKPTNPLLYGYPVDDTTPPNLQEIYAYPLNSSAVINGSKGRIQIPISRNADGTFEAEPIEAIGPIGFGFVAHDRQDKAYNRNGIYSAQLTVNGKVYSAFDFESFSFNETRLINTLIDFPFFAQYRKRIQKAFREPANALSIYSKLQNDGRIPVSAGQLLNIELTLSDIKGNTTSVRLPVQGKNQTVRYKPDRFKSAYYVRRQQPVTFDFEGASVSFPANSFYRDVFLDLKFEKDTFKVHDRTLAVHKNFTLSFDVSKYPESERKQLFIGRLDKNGNPGYYKTYKREQSFSTRTRDLGTFVIARDSAAPTIRARNFKTGQWLNNYSYLSLFVDDEGSGIDHYAASINGQWILLEYEPKNKTLTYNFDDRILNTTTCRMKVVVIDKVGNSTVFESTFNRK